jgi:transposase-like protein
MASVFAEHHILSAVGVDMAGRKHVLGIASGATEQIARQLEYDYASAARSLREGMKEMFTLQRLQIPASLHKCLATTNLIESPHSGVRKRTRNVCRWRDADMAERWAGSAWLLTEKHFRRIDGHQELWTLAAILGRECCAANKEKVA